MTLGGETPEGGHELWVPSESIAQVWDALLDGIRAAGGRACGQDAAEVLRVEAGQARFGKDYDEDSFPNEIGWEHALTYDKCYVGQEVVARMRTYGEVNRKLRGLLAGTDGASLAPGDPVYAGDEEAGRVTSFTYSTRLGKSLALASVKRRFWKESGLSVKSDDEELSVEQIDLPFVRLDATQ